jgi:uncharacterized membrane protein YeaQ/YmgE (transglycosylase-associated protein family)
MDLIISAISWAVFGLIIGLIARAIYPGEQAMGLGMTMGLGIIGSLVGGFLGWAVGYNAEAGPLRSAGWVMSIVGALIVVWAGLYFGGRRGTGARTRID